MNSLPDAKRVLILAPHPDDEALGCGGTIALYASSGADVHVAIISDGGKISHEFSDAGIDIIETRRQESIAASAVLGIRQTYFLGFPDGELESFKDGIRLKVESIVEQFRPDIIFSPSPVDYHADHIAVSDIALGLLNAVHGIRVAFYEVYETIRFNTLIDVSGVMDIKEKAVLEYHASLFNAPEIFFDAIKGLNRFRSFYTRENKSYEAFWIISGAVEKSEIINWLNYGMKEDDPASVFLAKIRTVDKLLFELKKCRDLLTGKEAEIQEQKAVIWSREKEILESGKILEDITKSLAWRLAKRFYGIRDKLLPEGSGIRKFYNKIISHAKSDKSGSKR